MAKLQTVDELHTMVLDHAEFMLIGDAGALPPTWWVQFNDRPGEMIVTPWDDEAEKLAAVEMIRDKLKDPQARNYAFVSEVWVATENAKRPSRLMPSERPDRREAVLVQAFNRNGKGGVRVYDIKRDDKGAVTALPETTKGYPGQFQGRMYNLFQDERSQHGVVRRDKPIVKGDATITRTPLNACLDCGRPISAGAPTPDSPDASTPNPGDLAICLHCAHVMIYANDLTVRAPTDAEVVEIAGDPDMVRAVNMIVAFNKREHSR